MKRFQSSANVCHTKRDSHSLKIYLHKLCAWDGPRVYLPENVFLVQASKAICRGRPAVHEDYALAAPPFVKITKHAGLFFFN